MGNSIADVFLSNVLPVVPVCTGTVIVVNFNFSFNFSLHQKGPAGGLAGFIALSAKHPNRKLARGTTAGHIVRARWPRVP
jgi:hypothetical protein